MLQCWATNTHIKTNRLRIFVVVNSESCSPGGVRRVHFRFVYSFSYYTVKKPGVITNPDSPASSDAIRQDKFKNSARICEPMLRWPEITFKILISLFKYDIKYLYHKKKSFTLLLCLIKIMKRFNLHYTISADVRDFFKNTSLSHLKVRKECTFEDKFLFTNRQQIKQWALSFYKMSNPLLQNGL